MDRTAASLLAMAVASSASDLARGPVFVDLFKSIEKFLLSCEHRFGLLLGLIELLNEVGGKRTVGSGLRGRHNNAPNSFRDLKCVNWQRHPFSGLNTAMVRTWCGPDGRRNAKNLARVRAKNARGSSRFPRQKNLRENLPAYAFRTGLTVEPNSSQSQKANRSRKLRRPETIRETMARSASVPISVSIKSS